MSAKEAFQQGSYHVLFSLSQLLELGCYKWFKVLSKLPLTDALTFQACDLIFCLDEHFVRFETNKTVIPRLVPQCSGVVLELGPGLGNQLCHFDKSKVTRIIGVECNPHFAPDCQQQIKERGLQNIYELILSGVQDSDVLQKHGIVAGSLDTVLSIQVLCSVPDPEAMAKKLYRLLKPGGKLIFWEHHRNSDWLTATVQCKWRCAQLDPHNTLLCWNYSGSGR